MILWALGCLPVPYVAPPVDMAAALDPRPVELPDDETTWPAGGSFRLGIAPLAMLEELQGRTVDPSAGFVANVHTGTRGALWELGGYARVALRPRPLQPGGGARGLIEPRVTAELVTDDQERLGGALIAGVAFRYAGWNLSDGRATIDLNGGFIGVSHGEWGVALTVDLGARHLTSGSLDPVLIFGVEVRAPAAAGLLLVPIF